MSVDFLKIDRFFIGSLEEEPTDKGLVSVVLNLAHTLDLRAIAEGVETEEQLARLRELKCEMAQGYYFWEPVSGEAASELLMAHSHRHPVGEAGV